MAELASLHTVESPQFKSWTKKLCNESVNANGTQECRNGFSNRDTAVWTTSNHQEHKEYSRYLQTTDEDRAGSIKGPQPVTLSWKDITVSTTKGKMILQGLSGEVKPGELIAIMGPSGAGKTTLLNVLSGFTNKKYSGQVLVNGTKRHLNSFRNLSCYVAQENLVHDYLTVKESVDIAASLKISKNVDKEIRHDEVQKVIDALGMRGTQDTRAGKLSGGEKKRLCIAQEIVNNPPIIFLDEPTSGLDSSSCLQCIQILQSLAKEGRTVVCTIHQPSSRVFKLFDKLYLMADGQRVYFGPTDELVPFLSGQGLLCPQYYNPADFAMEVLMGEYGDWNRKLTVAASRQNDELPESIFIEPHADSTKSLPSAGDKNLGLIYCNVDCGAIKLDTQDTINLNDKRNHPTSFCHQFGVLTYRNFLNFLRNPIVTHVQVIANIITGLFAGALFYGVGNDAEKMVDNAGFLYFCTFFALFGAMSATVMTFPLERAVVSREYLNNWYGCNAYFLSRCLTEVPHQIVLPLIFSSVAYWLTGQTPEADRFFLFLTSLILMSAGSQSLSFIVGALFNTQAACFVTCVIAIILTIFSGFLVRLKSMPVYLRFVTYLSLPRYILQALVFSIYGMGRKIIPCTADSAELRSTPEKLMETLDVNESEYYVYFGVPLLFILICRIVGYSVLRYKMKVSS